MGIKIAKEWVNCEVTFHGENRKQQLTSLRKKIFDHEESSCRKATAKLAEELRKRNWKMFVSSQCLVKRT
jgi:hypothetical protein